MMVFILSYLAGCISMLALGVYLAERERREMHHKNPRLYHELKAWEENDE